MSKAETGTRAVPSAALAELVDTDVGIPGTSPMAPTSSGRRWTERGPLKRLAASGFSRIAGISASLVGTQVVTSVLGLVFWALAARQFLPAEVGVAGAAIALMMLLGSLGSFGLGTVLIARLPVTDPAHRRALVRTCVAAAAAGGALLGLVVPAVAVHAFGATGLIPVAGSLAPLLGLAAGTALTSAVIVLDQAVLTVGIGALQFERNVTASAVKIVALAALGLAGLQGGMLIFLAWTIGNLVSLPLVLWRTRGGESNAASGRMVEPSMLRGIGKLALSHHALNVSIQAALQLLPVIVVVLVSANANASFNAAVMLAGFVFALPYAVSVGLFAAARGDESEVVSRMRLTIPFGLAVSAAAIIVVFPLAGPLLHIFGSAYAEDGTVLLRLIVLAGLPFVVKDHFIALRRVQGRTTQALAVTASFLVLELVAAVLGAQLGGVVGLCIGWLAVLAVEAILLAVPLLRALRTRSGAVAQVPATTEARVLTETPTALPNTAFAAVEEPRSPSSALGATDTPLEAENGAPSRSMAWLKGNLTGPTLFVMAVGVLVMTAVANAGRSGVTGGPLQAGWIVGLVLVFVPAALRILARSTTTVERVAVAIGLGLILQFSRLMLNPTVFAFHDELIHAETLRQIDETGHLFSFNSLLPVSGYYPGLEIVTNAVQGITGVPAFPSAIVTLMLARLIMVLAVIAVIRLVSGSYRAGAVGVLIYVTNPQLLFFNSQYSYQTLALPLALLAIYLFASRRSGARFSLVLPALVTAATIVSHHLTGALLIGAFAAWLVLVLVRGFHRTGSNPRTADAERLQSARADRLGLAVMTVWGALTLVSTVFVPGNPIGTYLGAIAGSSGSSLLGLTEGESTKALFANSAGAGPAPWERVLLIAAVLLATASMLLVLGYLRTSWRRARPFAILLGVIAILYPVIPGGHLTAATAEVGDRAAGFVFIGLAAVLGIWWWQRPRSTRIRSAFLLGCTVLFLGNVVLGAGPTATQLPGPYEISADARSVDADGLAAAYWLDADVPDESTVYADRTQTLLAGAYGGQNAILHVSTNIDASRLILQPTLGEDDLALIQKAQLDYLIVDERLSTGLPNQQVYIESGEYGEAGRTEPVSAEALTKFNYIQGVERIYDNGSLVIYNVQRLK